MTADLNICRKCRYLLVSNGESICRTTYLCDRPKHSPEEIAAEDHKGIIYWNIPDECNFQLEHLLTASERPHHHERAY